MAEGGQFWIAAGGQFSSAENTTNGKVMLSIPTDYDKPTITLFTMSGEQLSLDILNKSANIMQFSTQNMKAGIYLLQLKDSKHSETFKLFVY